MLKRNSLFTRIALGKAIGLAVGIAGFAFLTSFLPETSLRFRFGVLFWYITLGAIIGTYGVFTYHPILKLPMPWWFRAPVIGAWMNMVLTLFAYDQFEGLTMALFGEGSMFQSPYWFVLEGALVGAVMGFILTRYGGEGAGIVD